MKSLKTKSRWDVFSIPINELPDEPFLVTGDDGWFMTNKEYVERYNIICNWVEQELMYGKHRHIYDISQP